MRTTPTVDEVRSIIDNDPRYYYRTIKKFYRSFYDDLTDGGMPIAEALYCWLNTQGERPVCVACGGVTKFQTLSLGYFQYCSNKCAANANTTRARFEATSMARYGVSNPRQNPSVQDTYRRTMRERYGVDHPSMDATLHGRGVDAARVSARDALVKRRETNRQRYGVDMPAQSAEVLAKQKQTCMERYGETTPLSLRGTIAATRAIKRARFQDNLSHRVSTALPLSPTFEGINRLGTPILYPFRCHSCHQEFNDHLDDGRQPRCPYCHQGDSAGENELRQFLRGLLPDEPVRYVVRDLIAPREIDIYLPRLRLAFEYHGLYWHCEQKVGKTYHLEKHEACLAQGVHLVQIFESEWLGKRAVVEGRIRALVGKNQTLGARRCVVRRAQPAEVAGFLVDNHIQGTCPAAHAYLLERDGAIQAVMTFGRARFGADADMELLRYASRLGLSIPGGGSRLLAAFERDHPEVRLISYSDRRWNRGGLYRTLGFAHTHVSAPNYFYSKDRVTLLGRLAFQKHKLKDKLDVFDPHLSESQNMHNNGYIRIWDCGNDVFVRSRR